MLTGDLVRVRLSRGAIAPALIDPEAPALLEVAEELLAAFGDALAGRWPRGELDAAIDEVLGDRRDQKLVRGLAKVLLDRCEFQAEAPAPPVDLRARVFGAAAARGGVALARGPLDHPVAADVLAEVGAEVGLSAEALADALYADLPSEQRLVAADLKDPPWVLRRYNVALVQAILLHAVELRVALERPAVPRVRQLLRFAKFHELLHHAAWVGETLVLRVDGPTSIFHQSTRYGMQLARFFPALPLQDGPWSLEGTIRWKRQDRMLTVDRGAGLVSHYRDAGAWEGQVHQWFTERFEATPTEWQLDRQVEPVDLGGRAVVLPDFRLRRGEAVVYLEILGFWRKDYLERRVELLRRYGPGNLVLAVSTRLGAKEALADFDGAVVPFANVVPVRDVLAAADRIAADRVAEAGGAAGP